MRIRLLRFSIDGVSVGYCDIGTYLVWNAVVRFHLVGVGVCLGYKSFVDICGAVCKEEEEVLGVVSCVLLLLVVGLVDSAVLGVCSGSGELGCLMGCIVIDNSFSLQTMRRQTDYNETTQLPPDSSSWTRCVESYTGEAPIATTNRDTLLW